VLLDGKPPRPPTRRGRRPGRAAPAQVHRPDEPPSDSV
jgi:hypothetical protein